MFYGCEKNVPTSAVPTTQATTATKAGANDDRCSNLIASLFDMIQPDRLGVSSNRDTALASLNEWASVCAAGQGQEIEAPLPEQDRVNLEELLSSDVVSKIRDDQFVGRDVLHLRDCVLYKRMVEFAGGAARNDLDRLVKLFDYVVRNVDLVEGGSERIPLEPYWVFVFGKGTAEDRAWLFANLLKQMRIDSVILRPRSTDDDNEPSEHWLVGVLLDGDVYLFDPYLGLPIPADVSQPTSPFITKPATLRQIKADGDLLKRLDVDQDLKFPIQAGQLEKPRVQLIGDSGYWSQRMGQLQMSLTGKQSLVVFDGLQDSESAKGQITRVNKQSGEHWAGDAVSVWMYPETQLDGIQNLDDARADRLRVQQHAFRAPFSIENISQDPSGAVRPLIGPPERKQLKYRTIQLLGKYSDVIGNYLSIRLRAEFPAGWIVESEVRRTHSQAGEDAHFWIGVCQYEEGNYAASARTFRDYLKRYPNGSWLTAARYWDSLALAKDGRLDDALHPHCPDDLVI